MDTRRGLSFERMTDEASVPAAPADPVLTGCQLLLWGMVAEHPSRSCRCANI
jgi:hypothetical protein